MRLSLLLSAVVLTCLTGSAVASAPPGQRLCRFADPRITESSGLASSTDGRVLWTHNDSGDSARFFGVDPRTCTTRSAYRLDLPEVAVPGLGTVTSVDWEDLARGTDAQGRPVLLLADIGDNYQVRGAGVTVYQVAEPPPVAADVATEQPLAVTAVYQLLYPGGPRDAEALVALPDGRLVVVTKDRDVTGAYTGRSEVYASAGRPSTGPVALNKVADLDVTALPGVDVADDSQLAVTAADVTRDGARLVVRTYTTAYEYVVPAGDLTRAFAGRPRVLPLLASKQGEAVAYDVTGRSLHTSSEGAGSSPDSGAGVVDRYRLR